MAVRTKEELLEAVRAVIGEGVDDKSLSILEDVSDTMDILSGAEDWKKKYEDNDREWREKYRQRFFEAKEEKQEPEEPEHKKPMRFEDLFTAV